MLIFWLKSWRMTVSTSKCLLPIVPERWNALQSVYDGVLLSCIDKDVGKLKFDHTWSASYSGWRQFKSQRFPVEWRSACDFWLWLISNTIVIIFPMKRIASWFKQVVWDICIAQLWRQMKIYFCSCRVELHRHHYGNMASQKKTGAFSSIHYNCP